MNFANELGRDCQPLVRAMSCQHYLLVSYVCVFLLKVWGLVVWKLLSEPMFLYGKPADLPGSWFRYLMRSSESSSACITCSLIGEQTFQRRYTLLCFPFCVLSSISQSEPYHYSQKRLQVMTMHFRRMLGLLVLLSSGWDSHTAALTAEHSRPVHVMMLDMTSHACVLQDFAAAHARGPCSSSSLGNGSP
jgi:hypothetical protein